MSAVSITTQKNLFVFDVARALAAVTVLVAHARGFVLLDATQQPRLDWAGRLVFGLTALGHQAVIVFFVVSGALVTRSMIAMHQSGRWSATSFAMSRLVRIWVVLIPCLVIGGLLDRVGLQLGGNRAMSVYGTPGIGASMVESQLDGFTLAGNAAFLQGFAVPTFGSNLPLWTLSVEVWCYVVGFALFSMWRSRGAPLSVAMHLVCLGAIALGLLTPRFWLLLPIWLLGTAVAFALPAESIETAPACATSRTPSRLQGGRPIGLVAFGIALCGARALSARHQVIGDYLLACATAATLLVFSGWQPASRKLVGIVRFAAGSSYTLYLSHYPLLALLAAAVLRNRQLPLSVLSLALVAGAVVMAVVEALLLWGLFERHTVAVRRVLQSWLARSPFRPSKTQELAR